MGGREFWARVLTGVVVVAPLAGVALAAPAGAATSGVTSFSYVSHPGDYIGQGRSGTLSDASQFRVSGTQGKLSVSVDTGTEWWDVTLAAPRGRQLTTGVYTNATRAGFNDTTPGLDVSSTGRGCNETSGRFTVYAISADAAGRVTSLDAELSQVCDGSTGALDATVRFAAPAAAAVVLTSSNPATVAGQPVTLTARVAPGTGAVTFRNGSTVLGQASPDAAALARLTTSALAVGSHTLTVTQGTTTSAPVTQAVSSGSTSLWFASQFGDYIGQGATASYSPQGSTVTVSGTTAYATLSVDDPASGDWWYVVVAAPPGQTLGAGSYTGATRAAFRDPGEPGLDVSGSGRGCNTLTGGFTVNGIAANPDGSIASLDVSFTQHCEGGAASLSGRARYRAGTASPPVATTTTFSVVKPTKLGRATPVAVTVSSPSGAPQATGQVGLYDGVEPVGSATLVGGKATITWTPTAKGTRSLTVRYLGDPTHAASVSPAALVKVT
jgi:hypothetical protein